MDPETGERRLVKCPPCSFGTFGDYSNRPWLALAEESAPSVRIDEPDLELHARAQGTGDRAESDPSPTACTTTSIPMCGMDRAGNGREKSCGGRGRMSHWGP